jgi:hypothetical protein
LRPAPNKSSGGEGSELNTKTLSTKLNVFDLNVFIKGLPYAIIMIAGIWLRFASLGRASLWIDEAFVNWFTSKPWTEMFLALRLDGGNLPAHFVIVKLITGLLGESELTLRLFSAFIGCVGIALAMTLGWLVGEKPGAIAAGGFWAFNPMLIWYARDAKPYAFGATLALALILSYLMLKRRKSIFYSLTSILILMIGLMIHYYFFLVIMALMLFSIADLFSSPHFFRRWFVLTVVGFIPLAVWLYWYFSQPNPSIGIGWIMRPNFRDPFKTLWNFYSGYGGQTSLITTLFGIMAVLLTIVGVVYQDALRVARYSYLFGLIVPITAVWLISQRRPIYMDRYFIVILPFIIPPISNGMQRAWDFIARKADKTNLHVIAITGVAILIAVGWLAAKNVHIDSKYAREDWRGLVAYLVQEESNTPEVWFSDSESLIPFKYYFNTKSLKIISSDNPPACSASCWYVIRQPFTPTHSFAQAGSSIQREWLPVLPQSCKLIDQWESPSRLALWKVACGSG